jgi:hypothetical protein
MVVGKTGRGLRGEVEVCASARYVVLVTLNRLRSLVMGMVGRAPCVVRDHDELHLNKNVMLV